MNFENTKKQLTELAELWIQYTEDEMAIVELIEIDASICVLEYCIENNEKIGDINFHKLLELDENAEDYEENFNARNEFLSSIYYKDEEPYTDENISSNVHKLAAVFFEKIEN